jgi:taurine--2-oxoglutarate transaminase
MAPAVGDIRGMGLFWGLEFVRERETKEPFVTRRVKFEPNTLKRVSAAAMEMRVYVVNIIKTLIVAPPLIATEKEIDEGIEVLDRALEVSDGEAG